MGIRLLSYITRVQRFSYNAVEAIIAYINLYYNSKNINKYNTFAGAENFSMAIITRFTVDQKAVLDRFL